MSREEVLKPVKEIKRGQIFNKAAPLFVDIAYHLLVEAVYCSKGIFFNDYDYLIADDPIIAEE